MLRYNERLFVPVTWWFLGAAVVAILGTELWAGLGPLAALITYAVLLLVCGGTLLHWGSASIRVTDDELEAGGRRLPRNAIGEVVPLDERQTRAARGARADPAAYLLVRPYLKHAVYIEVVGQPEAAPYWLVGTRRPAELAAALSAIQLPGADATAAMKSSGASSEEEKPDGR